MGKQSRGRRDRVVRALARVSLLLALTLLGALFMSTAANGDEPGGGYSLTGVLADGATTVSTAGGRAPSTAGLVLALVVIAVGVCVLGYGAAHSGRRRVDDPVRGGSADPAPDEVGTR